MNRIIAILIFVTTLFNYAQGINTGTTTGFVESNGGKLYYETAGSGETIVLIHDGMVHSVIWDNQFNEFAKKYKVVRYDRRGFGKSSFPTAAFSHIEDLNQIFTKLNIDKAVLIGMSAGGGLAIDFTIKYPQKVNTLILVGAVVGGFNYTSHMFTRGGRIDITKFDFKNKDNIIQFFGWDDPYEVYPENIQAKQLLLSYLKNNPNNVDFNKYAFETPPQKPALGLLNTIKVPTLILVGEFDIPDVHAHSGAINAGIQNSKREIINKAAHLIPLEQPEEFNNKVKTFIAGTQFYEILKSKGTKAAVDFVKKNTDTPLFLTEKEINDLGYENIAGNNIKDAIELFLINTILFPNSANAYDSLGEAYMLSGNKELAIKNYNKSLELNPNNTNAVEQLKKLR